MVTPLRRRPRPAGRAVLRRLPYPLRRGAETTSPERHACAAGDPLECRGMTYVPAAGRYERMRYRRCGRSGLKLPEISLGLWQNFGDDRPLTTQRAIIRRAFDLGVTHFDLANNYGGIGPAETLGQGNGSPYGSAEINFGRIMREDLRPYRDELIISTKAGYDMWPGPYGDHGSRKYLLASLDQSLRRMGLE